MKTVPRGGRYVGLMLLNYVERRVGEIDFLPRIEAYNSYLQHR